MHLYSSTPKYSQMTPTPSLLPTDPFVPTLHNYFFLTDMTTISPSSKLTLASVAELLMTLLL